MNSLADPNVVEVLDRLHREAEAQTPELRKRMAATREGGQMTEDWPEQMRDFYLPVSREQGRFLYQTVRAVRAERVVEFGTSFGVSSIYLTAGLRDNGGGILVGSELVEDKAVTARQTLAAAGLAELLIRVALWTSYCSMAARACTWRSSSSLCPTSATVRLW